MKADTGYEISRIVSGFGEWQKFSCFEIALDINGEYQSSVQGTVRMAICTEYNQ
jgi:hypothetical protein